MNFPGFDWSRDPVSINHNTQYKTIHNQFKSFLSENCLTQIVDVPTHVKGNTLDVVYSTNPSSLSHKVVYPGISDHFLVSVDIRHCQNQVLQQIRTRRLYRKANIDKFQEALWLT